MYRHIALRTLAGILFLLAASFFVVSSVSGSPASLYNPALRRYPYLTDVVGAYATINWGTDRSESSGGIRFGKVGSESCTAHYVAATKTAIAVNSVLQYQWKAQLTLEPGTQYCYRVYLGSSPVTEIDLLGSDSSPSFWTQVPSGASQPFSFIVFGDWGYVDSTGANPYQADLMALMAASGSRFAVTTGDNGYPGGTQNNFGDLVQTGADLSAIFGPAFWKVPGASLPIFPTLGNHGYYSSQANHPALLTWPQDRAASTSGGRYLKETYCCLNGSLSRDYPSAWYAFDAGPARFYMLTTAWQESNSGTASEYEMDYDYHIAPGTPQYEWLAADLAAHPSVLKFAFFHYPLYSDNPHEATDTFLLGSNSLEGLLKQNGVDIAFTGHAHIYERNLASAEGVINYLTGGGGATLGTLGTCTALDAYAIKFTTTGKGCGSAPTPTSAAQVYHFLKVTVNGTSVTVTPINALGQSFDVVNYSFTSGAETTPPSTPANLSATSASGTQINLSWSASSDNTGVRGYGIYRDGVLIDTVAQGTLSYSDFDLLPATNYVYRVDAFDGSGNHSALSTSDAATTQNTATYTFAPVADAYVVSNAATTNYGLSNTLRADASPETRSYLRFNVGDLGGVVTQATLRLYTTSSSSTGYQVRQVTNQGWEEASVTFNTAPGVGSSIGSSGNIASGNWTSVDVTALITGSGVYDLALTTTTSTTLNFNSRDATSNQPQLVIQTSASAGPTPTATQTNTPPASGNLVVNPGFEAQGSDAADAANWTEGTNHTRSSDKFHTGGWSLHSTFRGVGTDTHSAAPIAVSPNTTYTYSGYIWRTNSTGSACMDMNDIAGEAQLCTSSVGSWQFLTGTWNSGSNTSVTLRLITDGLPTGDIWFDDISLTGPGGPTATPSRTATPTATVGSGGPITFAAVADARVSESSPNTNYGTATTFLIDSGSGAAQSGFIRFNVTGLNGSIQNAKLRVFCTTNGTNNGPAAYLAGNSWIESGTGGVTWNTQPALLSGAFDNKGAITTNTWVEYDVTALVTGDGVYTFALIADGTDGVVFSTREGSMPPQLVVTPGTGSPAPTSTSSSTATVPSEATDTPTATSTMTATPTATAGSANVLTFITGADARVSEASPTTNYGTSTTLQADAGSGSMQTSFARFTVSGTSGTIQSAKLRVFCTTNGTNNGPAAYLAGSNWVESGTGGITWNNQPALLSGAFDNKGAITTNTWVEYDVTALVSGDGIYTFALIADGTDGVTFSSRQGSTAPELVVTFVP